MKNLRKILLFVFIFAILVVGYMFFSKKDTNQPAASGTLGSTTGVANVSGSAGRTGVGSDIGREFLTSLLNLKNITLDDSLFTEPSFTSLQDFSTTVAATSAQGRPNPFAPLGLDSSTATSALGGGNGLVVELPPVSGGASGGADTGNGSIPAVNTLSADLITRTTATLHGSFSQSSGGARFFEWGTSSSLGTTTAEETPVGTTWSKKITGLTPATTYSFRASAKVGTLTFYGPILTFKTLAQ